MNEEFTKIKRYVQHQEKISVSHLQRKFCIGYNKASKYVEMMEESGVVSLRDKYGFRTVLRKIYVWNI